MAISGLLLAAPSAIADPLPSSSTPLNGSTFQGGDGNQDDAAPYIDWQALQGADRVVHAHDDNAQDTAFVGGSKVLRPIDWDKTTEAGGVDPGKVNIFDAWGAVDQPGRETFLYLAFTREDGTGTAAITFELNRDGRLWNNGHTRIPCRTTGDVLVTTLPHGNDVDIELYQWTTTRADAATGCAEIGTIQAMDTIPPNTGQGAVNAAAITSRLPGTYPQGSQVPSQRFSEVALNLSALMEDAFDDECFAFASIWMHSRSSDSESSNVQDYVSPRAISVRTCAASGTKFFDRDADGVRDAGEPGLPRFVIWADYDNDGVRDGREPFAVTDKNGRYVIDGIRPRLGSYRLREELVGARRTSTVWRCSYPNRGTQGGFVIWADYDNDGVRDGREPFAVTDTNGRYVIDGIRPPSGTYRLREELVGARRTSTAWRCSFPNRGTQGGFGNGPGGLFGCGWGPITVATSPNVTDRDFGNWVPASLTVEKQLWPSNDPGRFDLIVNGVTVRAAAGDGDKVTILVRPGTYNVSEAATAGTDPANYDSTVACRTVTSRRGALRSGTAWNGLVLRAGARARCRFTNVRKLPTPVPAIAIEKTTDRPLVEAGDTLRYTLYVTNPGRVALPARGVTVTDNTCDDPPALTSKNGDTSPRTLDPGDTWTYTCSYETPEAGAECEQTFVTNTATASGSVDGSTVTDEGTVTVGVTCPDVPPEPIPPDPDPGPDPSPITPFPDPAPSPSPEPPFVPPGPEPPNAGAAGIAGIAASNLRCVVRASQILLTGERMDEISVSVDGRRLGTRQVRLLQRRVVPLNRIIAAGTHRLTIRVSFEQGSATAPVTLTRTVTVCARARAPRVTG